ncbi:MAG: fused MFS/spermidine synthase [Blastopirellula sp. JB062]
MSTLSRRRRKNNSPQAGNPPAQADAVSWRELTPLLVVMGLATLSGMAALTHELLWTRRVIDVIGASNDSSARVFGCFFLGLSLGAAIASRFDFRSRNAWLGIAIAEFLVFLCALPGIFLAQWTDSIWLLLGASGVETWQAGFVKTLVPAVVVTAPAVAMGMTLPWMVAIVAGGASKSNRLLWLYGLNTIGGVVGIFLTTGWLLHQFGVQSSMWIAAGANLLISVSAIAYWRMTPPSPASPIDDPIEPAPESPAPTMRHLLFYSFASGFGVLSFEVLALHLTLLVAPLSFYAPAAILAAFVFSLAIASFLFPWLLKQFSDVRQFSGLLFAAAAIALGMAPFLFLGISQNLSLDANSNLWLFSLKLTGLVFVTTGPAVLLMGFVFPAQLHEATQAAGATASKRWGLLLAMNGLGGLVGAEVAVGILLPNFGVHVAIGVVSSFYALLFISASLRTPEAGTPEIASSLGLLAICVWLTASPMARLPQMNPHLPFDVVELRNGREGTVAVVESEAIGRAIIMSNQYVLGSSSVRWDEERQAHLPLLLHPRPQNVAFIGVATGITPGAALRHSEVENLVAIELSPLVASAADRHFREFNYDITRSDRAKVVIEDGRLYMATMQNQFDLVIGDLFLPWGPGEGRLYSLEHFRAVRQALRPGGAYCQWLAMYQLTPEQFDVIVSTFRKVFPEIYFFRSTFETSQPALAMVGYRDGKLDWDQVAQRCHAVRAQNASLDPSVRHPDAVAMLSLGDSLDQLTFRRNTLNNLAIELDAGKQRVTGDASSKYLHGSRWLAFLNKRRYLQPSGDGKIDRHSQTGQLLAEIALLESLPEDRIPPKYANRRKALKASCFPRISEELRNESAADWSTWPGPQLSP